MCSRILVSPVSIHIVLWMIRSMRAFAWTPEPSRWCQPFCEHWVQNTVGGIRLYLICTPDGMPEIWGLANPKIGEHEPAETMLRHDRHLLHLDQVIIGDKGFAGREFETFITDNLGAHLIPPDRKDEKKRFGKLGIIRQSVKSVFDTLVG